MATSASEQFSLKWNNFHSNLTTGFHQLLESSEMVDVTLAVEGHFFQAHKIVLSICSPYFKQMFKVNPCKHPIVILRDVSHNNMKDILEFMYLGEVNVLRENLTAFLRTAELLQVKGLTGDDSSDTSSRKDDRPESLPDNDEEQDLIQYNHQMIDDSDVDLSIHYSTPRADLPPHYTTMQPPTPPPNQKPPTEPQPYSKRPTKSSSSNSNSKRSKTDNNSLNQNFTTSEPSNSLSILTVPESEQNEKNCSGDVEESKDSLRQMLENNFNSSSANSDINASEHDALLCNADLKGHVYCPYCFRKFVNRYNLKVHIRDKHEDNPFNLRCGICERRMRNKSCLRVHMYQHRKQQLEAQAAAASASVAPLQTV